MNEILSSYIEDLRDSILLFNESLISVQNGEKNSETVNNIFRVAHTIKGNSAAMGFTKIQKVMHTMEDLLSEVRNGSREMTDELNELLFACHDFLEDCLDTIQSEATDAGMETEALLSKLVAMKENKPDAADAPKAKPVGTAPPEAEDKPAENTNLGFNMANDLWEVLYENTKSGYNAYKVNITFMKNTSMKAVRAWMIFDRIDQSGILLWSDPPRLGDGSLNATGETPFEADVIETVILSEQEISDLAADLKATTDIESVTVTKLNNADIQSKIDYIRRIKKLVEHMQDTEVDLLGVDLQFMDEKLVRTICERLKLVIASKLVLDNNPIYIISNRLSYALEESLNNRKKIPIKERENIIHLFHMVEESLKNSQLLSDYSYVSSMYMKLEDIIDVVTSPEKKIGDILTSSGLIKESDVPQLLETNKENEELKFGQRAVKKGLVSAYDIINALNEKPEQAPAAAQSGTAAKPASSSSGDGGIIRVPVAKVDTLIDMLSELLIYNSQLEQGSLELVSEDSKMSNILTRTEKLIKEIQELSMSLRMIELKQTFNRLTRIARDTATDLNKKIKVNFEGEDTEIDRSAVEKLFDPLMHMVRNAVSHGIEDNEEKRMEIGKKPEGQITIAGYSKRGNVYIEVRDDGRGIDTKKVYEKAKKQGLINENREYTEQEIFKFIFLPGFSTMETVNNISGRGVGMNVVEDVINKLGGKIEVDSQLGAGSTFRLKLPINLAVVNGTIVVIEGIKYIIPTMCVKKFFMAKEKDWVSIQGENRAVKMEDGSIVSLISKEKVFGLKDDIIHKTYKNDSSETEYSMVLLEIDQKLLVLHVDKILGRQDVVSKPLAADSASVSYANSASILGDGVVSLILDIDAIFKISQPV